MTDDRIRTLLLDAGHGPDGAWNDELRIGENTWNSARLLPEDDAAALMGAGMIVVKERAPPDAPPRLRDHFVCVLSVRGLAERQRIIDEHGAQFDDVVLATGLGEGSPIVNRLTEIRDILADGVAELVTLRCATIVAAKMMGAGDRFAALLEEALTIDADEREGTER